MTPSDWALGGGALLGVAFLSLEYVSGRRRVVYALLFLVLSAVWSYRGFTA